MAEQDRGRFTWYELNTNSPETAVAFYEKVIGWEVQIWPMGHGDYRMLKPPGGEAVAGIMPIDDEAKAMGARPMWLAYTAVADVDAAGALAVARGGHAISPAFEVPNVGRMQVLMDPWGAIFAIHAFDSAMSPPKEKALHGEVVWHELLTDDIDGALAFYGELFGWEKGESMDTPTGPYQILLREGQGLGGVMKRPEMVPVNYWVYYVHVDDLDGALAKVEKAGGKVVMPPMPIPGGSRIAQLLDAEGAVLALLGM